MFISLLSPFIILKAKKNGPNVNLVYGIYSKINRPLKKGELALTLPIGSNTSHSDHLYTRLMPLDSNLAHLIGTPLIKSDILEYFDVLDDRAELDKALKTLDLAERIDSNTDSLIQTVWLQNFSRVKTKQELKLEKEIKELKRLLKLISKPMVRNPKFFTKVKKAK